MSNIANWAKCSTLELMRLILASQSTNRKRLLEQVGLEFEVVVSNYTEDMSLDMKPEALVQELALGKASEVAKRNPDDVVIGADTVFVANGKVGGKPHDESEALDMLIKLRGAPHLLVSGYAIVKHSENMILQDVVTVQMTMRKDLSDADLIGYIKVEREPVTTKAGAYDVANKGIGLLEKIDGDYSAGLGLPIGLVLRDLKAFGINPFVS